MASEGPPQVTDTSGGDQRKKSALTSLLALAKHKRQEQQQQDQSDADPSAASTSTSVDAASEEGDKKSSADAAEKPTTAAAGSIFGLMRSQPRPGPDGLLQSLKQDSIKQKNDEVRLPAMLCIVIRRQNRFTDYLPSTRSFRPSLSPY
jgi:hypothetical protein